MFFSSFVVSLSFHYVNPTPSTSNKQNATTTTKTHIFRKPNRPPRTSPRAMFAGRIQKRMTIFGWHFGRICQTQCRPDTDHGALPSQCYFNTPPDLKGLTLPITWKRMCIPTPLPLRFGSGRASGVGEGSLGDKVGRFRYDRICPGIKLEYK